MSHSRPEGSLEESSDESEQLQRSHKRARLSSSPRVARAPPDDAPAGLLSNDGSHDEEDQPDDELRTPERDFMTPTSTTPHIKKEPVERCVSIEVVQDKSPSPPPSPPNDRSNNETSDGVGFDSEENQVELMDGVQAEPVAGSAHGGLESRERSRSRSRSQVTSVQAGAQTSNEPIYPRWERRSGNAWSLKSELALIRYIANEPLLREWTNSSTRSGTILVKDILQRFSDLTQGPSLNALRNKIIRMDEIYRRFRLTLSPATLA